MILRACTVCGRLTEQKRCPDHRCDTRPPPEERGYDEAWQRVRRRVLRARPICEEPGCTLPATDVHHIDGRGPRGDNSDGNLRALCHSHHSRITAAENGSFGRPTNRPAGTGWDASNRSQATG